MSTIGNFTYDQDSDAYTGSIVTLNFQFPRVAITATGNTGDKQPDYRVTVETEFGPVELGSAWKRTSERGQEFLSVSLDGPLLDSAINTAVFLKEDGTRGDMVWSRQKAKANDDTKAKPKKKAA